MTINKKDESVLIPSPGDLTPDVRKKPESVEAPDVKIDEAAQKLIGHQLRTIYGQIVSEPIPDQLLKLLHELECKETK